MNKEIIAGRWEQLKGAAMEKYGRMTHRARLIGRGKRERAAGRLRERLGKLKERAQKSAMVQYR